MRIFSAMSWWEHPTFQWDDYDVHFVLDQHAYYIWIFIVLALWNNSMDGHVASLRHIILIPTNPVLSVLNAVCLVEKQKIPISSSLVWPDQGLNLWSTILQANILTFKWTRRLSKNDEGYGKTNKFYGQFYFCLSLFFAFSLLICLKNYFSLLTK